MRRKRLEALVALGQEAGRMLDVLPALSPSRASPPARQRLQYLARLFLAQGGGIVPPPPIPDLPAGAGFLLEIDAGRTVAAGHLTRWVDQSTNAFVFTPPGGKQGFVVTADQYQAFDEQNVPDGGNNVLTSPAAQPFADNTPVTLAIYGKLGANYGRINCALVLGTAGCEVLFGSDFYFTGLSNVSGPGLAAQSPFVFMYNFTPGSGALTATYNGWPASVAALTTILDFTGTPPAVTGPGIELGPDIADPPFNWGGDFQEAGEWPLLNPTDLLQANEHYAAKFLIPNARGYMTCGGETTPFNALGSFVQLVCSYAIVKLFTTATTFTIDVQNQITAAASPPSPTGIVVVIDGVYDHTIPIADTSSPWAPVTYTVTSAKLDGNPHVVELWHGTEGTPINPGEESQGEVISRVQDPTGQTKIYPTDTSPAPMLVMEGDSNVLGFGVDTNDPALGAFQMIRLDRTLWPGRIAFWATFGRQVFTEDQFGFANAAARISLLMGEGGGTQPQVVWVELGLNDWHANTYTSVGAFGTAYGALLDAIHTACPNATIVAQAPIVCATEMTPNGHGWTLVQERVEIATQAATRSSFVIFVDGSQSYHGVPAPNAGELTGDGFHLTTAGQLTYKTWAAEVLSVNFLV